MTKEQFKKIYKKEMEELSRVESAIDKLGFQMNGRTDVHKNTLYDFEHYVNIHDFKNAKGESDKPYYAYVLNGVIKNWNAFHDVCFQLWNFSKMSMGSLETFYTYIYSAFEMIEEGTFEFEDYTDEQFQIYMSNLEKFFSRETCDEIRKTFIDYLEEKGEWHEEYFKC